MVVGYAEIPEVRLRGSCVILDVSSLAERSGASAAGCGQAFGRALFVCTYYFEC